ncbi:hypothetical protein DFA_02379 [Cavenderia fasciculata]|uniref:Ankyrin repeat-containing protein n=1 Tax=Cavenderia fasciculata TaxID=261658 RepID=F4PZA3_CACFS|nr:uncharacterized protein DFA_02379 [Cavenderia fasciculata]EGG19132.1 hypothetical protein DFA_02379 [Cavenderia fasciculata]|eukprot:XP_004366765.1 hypothetical protein DFA_02379 [Cavenderia fasciculata]
MRDHLIKEKQRYSLSFYLLLIQQIKGCDDERCNQSKKEQHDRVIKSVLCNLVLFRRIISVSSIPTTIKTYKIDQLPNKIGWYLRGGHINLLKERIEREELELLQFNNNNNINNYNNNTLSSSSSTLSSYLNSFTIKKDYLFEHHLRWNYDVTIDICSFGGEDERHLELFKYLFEKKLEWFNHPDCFKMAASKGNIEIFKILVDNTVPIKIQYDMNECIRVAIQGMHPDMARYLLEMNHFKFNRRTQPFSLKGGLFKHSQSDLIKLARLFVDIVDKNKESIEMYEVFKLYFYNLLLPTRDIDTVKYGSHQYTFDSFIFEGLYPDYLRTGLPQDIDPDHHIDFIKQVVKLFIEPEEYERLVGTTNKLIEMFVIDEELDCVEDKEYNPNNHTNKEEEEEEVEEEEEENDNINYYYFDSLAQLSTKQSRWTMFMIGMCLKGELHQEAPVQLWSEIPLILKVRVKEDRQTEFMEFLCKLFGWEFIMNNGRLEYVKLAHSLGLIKPDKVFYPNQRDSNQTLAIMQYLHDNGINPFAIETVNQCGKNDDKVIMFLHQHYPQLLRQDDVLKYIKKYGHYYLTSILVVPTAADVPQPRLLRRRQQRDIIKDSRGIDATSLDAMIKLCGSSLYYYYDDRVGQEGFQLLQQYYNDDSTATTTIEATYQEQLEISTENNQIDIVEWLLFKQQTKKVLKPTFQTLVSILTKSYDRQYKQLYKLIKMYYRENIKKGQLLQFNSTTWNAIGSRGDIKMFDRFMTKHKQLDYGYGSVINEAIIHNQLAFIQHLYTQYPQLMKINVNCINNAITNDRPKILKYFLDLAHQEKSLPKFGFYPRDQNSEKCILAALDNCVSHANLSCFKMIYDQDYFDFSILSTITQNALHGTYQNLPIANYLVHHGDIDNTNADQLSLNIPFLKELLEKNTASSINIQIILIVDSRSSSSTTKCQGLLKTMLESSHSKVNIISVLRKNDGVEKYYKINQLPNKIGWYLCYGHINLLKERIEREEKELHQFKNINNNNNNNTTLSSSSSTLSSQLNSFTIKKDYLFELHLKWNYEVTEEICSYDGQDEQHLVLFKYLFEKKPEWFNHSGCFKMAASKGNIDMFKILVDNSVPIKIQYDMNECIQVAIEGLHPDMARYLLEMNHFKFKVTTTFNKKYGLFKHSQSDLIKLARLFVDIANNNKESIEMHEFFKEYFYNLLLPTRDIESVNYGHDHYHFDAFVFKGLYPDFLLTGLPQGIDPDHHLEFIKQVLKLNTDPDKYERLVGMTNNLIEMFVIDEELDSSSLVLEEEEEEEEKEEEEEENDNINYYFNSLTQLSTKQSRWTMFMFGMCLKGELPQEAPAQFWSEIPLILKVRVKEDRQTEFMKLLRKLFGWGFIMNNGRLEHVKLAHSLGLVSPKSTFKPKHKDINQTLGIMQYLHNNGISPFTVETVKHCGKSDDKVIMFLHQHYPQLVQQDDVLNYIKKYGHYYLTSILVVPDVVPPLGKRGRRQKRFDIKDSRGINATSLDAMMKLCGYCLFYNYDDRVGQEGFQLLQQYYNNSTRPSPLRGTIQEQLVISTNNNQIEIVEFLLFIQTKCKPNIDTLISILTTSYDRQYKQLYKLIKRYYRENIKGQLLQFNQSTWNAIGSRGDIKMFDRFMAKHKPLEDYGYGSVINEAIIHNQLAFIQHLYTQYPQFKIDGYYLAQQEKSLTKFQFDPQYLNQDTEQIQYVLQYQNLPIANYLVYHGYIVDDKNTELLSKNIPFLEEFFQSSQKSL